MQNAKPTFDQVFSNVTLPVKPTLVATGAKITHEEFANVDLSGPTKNHFGGMLANAGFTQADEAQPTQRVVTI